jgi:heptosyltransferase-2
MRKQKNILLTCTVNLGDVVLATSAAALIKQQVPGCRVSILVKAGIGEILQNHPMIDEILVLNNKAKSKSWGQMWQFVKEIRKRQFDMSIALDRKLRPAILTMLAGIPLRVGPDRVFDYKSSRVTMLYNCIVKTPADFLHTHQAEIFQSIVRGALGIDGKARPVLGAIEPVSLDKAKKMLAVFPTGKCKIALCIRGTYSLRNWPIEKFALLIDRLQTKYDAAFYIVGAPEDKEYADSVCKQTTAQVMNFCGRTSLKELTALLQCSDVFITIDTGSMHIAAAMDVATVGIFRCATQWRWAPFSENAKVVTGNTACQLVDRPEACPMQPCPNLENLSLYPCVADIQIEQIEEAVAELLTDKMIINLK